MRRMILAAAATFAILGAVSFAPGQAQAAPVPAGIAAAVQDASPVQEAAYVCRRVWRCGPYGCGWRRVCWWTGPRYYRYHRYYRHHRHWW